MEREGHHRHSRRAHRAARVVRIIAIAMCAVAMLNFSCCAYLTSDCFSENPDPRWGHTLPRVAVASDECRVLIQRRDITLRIDALAALLAVALFIGAGVALSRIQRRTKRWLIGIEAVVVFLMLTYATLWLYPWR